MNRRASEAGERSSLLHLGVEWDTVDRHRLATLLAVAGLVAAGTMAVLGLPPVDLHGPLHRFGIMDPLCGGTRSVRYAAMGEWGLSWRYNPLGVPLLIGAILVLARTSLGVVSHRWLTVRVHLTKPTLMIVLAAAVVLEVNQQLHAELLTGP